MMEVSTIYDSLQELTREFLTVLNANEAYEINQYKSLLVIERFNFVQLIYVPNVTQMPNVKSK